MSAHDGLLFALAVLGFGGALVGLAYFVYRGLQTDHETGDYEFTWGVAVVLLFLMGFGPGLVGAGLYLVVERDYPAHWAWLGIVLGLGVLVVAGYAFSTGTLTYESGAAAREALPSAHWIGV